jgi:hypothetical protein
MDNKLNENIFVKAKNQIFGIFIVTIISGLGMNFLFMFTINQTVNQMNENYIRLENKIENINEKLFRINTK